MTEYLSGVQVLWCSAVISCCLRFSSQHSHLHPAAFHTTWVLTLIGLLFFIKAQLLHNALLQHPQLRKSRKRLLAVIALLCMGVGAAGSFQILNMRHSHVRAHPPSVRGLSQPRSFSESVTSWPLLPHLVTADSTVQHASSQSSWMASQHHGFSTAEERIAHIAQVVLALVCTVSASMSAHGAAGYVLHHHATDKARSSTWAFFQPFRGGATFIAVQFLGWTLFTIEVLGLLHVAQAVARGLVIPKFFGAFLAAGMVLVPVLLAFSALSFQERKTKSGESKIASEARKIPFMERWDTWQFMPGTLCHSMSGTQHPWPVCFLCMLSAQQ